MEWPPRQVGTRMIKEVEPPIEEQTAHADANCGAENAPLVRRERLIDRKCQDPPAIVSEAVTAGGLVATNRLWAALQRIIGCVALACALPVLAVGSRSARRYVTIWERLPRPLTGGRYAPRRSPRLSRQRHKLSPMPLQTCCLKVTCQLISGATGHVPLRRKRESRGAGCSCHCVWP